MTIDGGTLFQTHGSFENRQISMVTTCWCDEFWLIFYDEICHIRRARMNRRRLPQNGPLDRPKLKLSKKDWIKPALPLS
jgi:hypothetical protein